MFLYEGIAKQLSTEIEILMAQSSISMFVGTFGDASMQFGTLEESLKSYGCSGLPGGALS